jgi:hypothetical protein
VFQPGVASPSYPPPPASPTSQFQPTSVYQPTGNYPGYPPAPPGKTPGTPGYSGSGGGRSGGALLWVLIAVFAVLLCGGAGVAGFLAFQNASDDKTTSSGTPATAAPQPPAAEPTTDPTTEPTESAPAGAGVVTYEVTGDGPASITYLRGGNQGGSERVSNATLPWREEVRVEQKSFVVSLIATRSGPDRGTLTCRVLVDGKELVKRSTTGTFATVACIDLVVD